MCKALGLIISSINMFFSYHTDNNRHLCYEFKRVAKLASKHSHVKATLLEATNPSPALRSTQGINYKK